MSDRKPNQEIELAKINLASQFKTGHFLTFVATWLGGYLALFGMWYQSNTIRSDVRYFVGSGFIAVSVIIAAYVITYRPFSHYMEYLNEAIKRVETGQSIGDLNDVIKGKRKRIG